MGFAPPPPPSAAPLFPAGRRLGIGVLGAGAIAQTAHLPAYGKYDLEVAGVWSRTAATTSTIRERFPFVRRVYDTAEDLLADPAVDVVDIATPPDGRAALLDAAVAAGKHVLAQKPLTDDVGSVLPVLDRAERAGLRVAVNQNARWAPPWRVATLLVRQGAVGEVVGVTHLHDKPLPPIAGTRFDALPHMLVADYLVHWLDITRCWLEGKQVTTVRAEDHRTPGQPDGARSPWSATCTPVTRRARSGSTARRARSAAACSVTISSTSNGMVRPRPTPWTASGSWTGSQERWGS
jgi:predicted dehydrogenase